MNYAAYREAKIASGTAFQDHAVRALYQSRTLIVVQYTSALFQQRVGESCTGIEIKHDELFASTGNLYIETEEKAQPRPGPYAPSGIYRENCWLYVIGNYQVLFGFAVLTLRALHQSDRFRSIENSFGTSRGFLLPDADARLSAAFVVYTDATTAQQHVGAGVIDLERLGRVLYHHLRRDSAQRQLFRREDGEDA